MFEIFVTKWAWKVAVFCVKNDFSKQILKCNILLHDHFEGCNEIAKLKGQQFFIPRGEAPRDEKLSPEGFSNFNAARKMIVQ